MTARRRRWDDFVAGESRPGSEYVLGPHEHVWINNLYQVIEDRPPRQDGQAAWVYLSIKRRDREPIHDWRDLQRIKNEIAGPEAEAVELYPAESRLVDNANQYHLWCLLPPHRFTFGFQQRSVSDGGYKQSKQRPWFEGERPPDAMTSDEATAAVETYRRRDARA